MGLSARYFNISGFPRDYGAHVEELNFLRPFLPERQGVMIDVGSHKGESFGPFLGKGWQVYAFEPDPGLYNALASRYSGNPLLALEQIALADVRQDNVAWFTTPDSDGAGSILGFTDKHNRAGSVKVTTLSEIVGKYSINKVDLLKIDAEGFDFKVLKGFPFEKLRPAHIICEYEDLKTMSLGYNMADMANTLISMGYTVYLSEWHPIIRYGIRHQWQGFRSWPAEMANSKSWGNLLAFSEAPNEIQLYQTVEQCISRFPL